MKNRRYWKCPICESKFYFHNGPPSSGGPLAVFTKESASILWEYKDECCAKVWWDKCLGGIYYD